MGKLICVAAAWLLVAVAMGQSADERGRGRTIRFGGIEWWVKESGDRKVGPGPNWFSSENVEVDAAGRLHLKIGDRAGSCVSAEVVAQASLGYGTYRFTVGSNLDAMAKNLILGLFTWDDTTSASFHRELDVELGRWNRETDADGQFVVQPYTVPRNIVRFRLPRGLTGSVHSFTWAPDVASFRSSGIGPPGATGQIQEHVFDRMVPEPGEEKARINLWCMDGKAPKSGVSEVILSGFEFSPPR